MALLRMAPTLLVVLVGMWVQHAAAIQIGHAKDNDLRSEGNEPGTPSDEDGASSPCAGCELTVNMKCDGIRSLRSAPFHRIQDCLLPLYGLIELARNASLFEDKRVCAVTWLDSWEGIGLLPFLKNLSGVHWHSIINEREECTKQLEYHAVNRTTRQMATTDYVARLGTDEKMVQAHPIDMAKNLPLLQADIERLFHDGQWDKIVMITRRTGSRMFRPIATQELINSLVDHTSLPVVEYLGKETAMDTMKLFSSAKGVIGYHGAAWVNTYFATGLICNMQVSTFYDFESTQPWRINKELMMNPRGSWYFYYLPINMLLDANHVLHDAYLAREEKDHFIKDLEWIPLRNVDVADLSQHMESCLADPAEYKQAHPKPESQIFTHGWDELGTVPTFADGRLSSNGRNQCSGCDVTVDLRCQGLHTRRSSYYSVIAECLLPAYEMVQVAREAASNSSAQVCAITWSEENSLRPFLESLVDVKWHKILSESDECADSVAYHTTNSTLEEGASKRWVDEFSFEQDKRIIHTYPIDVKQNIKWMQKDAVNIAGKPIPHVIIIQNENTRVLSPKSLHLLNEKLTKYMSQMEISVYSGEGTVTEMVKRFANLAGVVGYWNELWVNTLFSSTPHCAVQMSTYEDFDKTKTWRTSEEIKRLNPMGDWYFDHIPLDKILEGNERSRQDFLDAPDKDVFIRDLPWAGVPDQDIVDVASRIFLCWQNKERAYSYAMESWGWHGHA